MFGKFQDNRDTRGYSSTKSEILSIVTDRRFGLQCMFDLVKQKTTKGEHFQSRVFRKKKSVAYGTSMKMGFPVSVGRNARETHARTDARASDACAPDAFTPSGEKAPDANRTFENRT